MFLGSGFGCAPPLLAEVLECVSLCVRAACTPPILACGRGACFSVRDFCFHPAIPGWGVWVCVFVCALRLYRQSWLRCAVWVCVLEVGFRLCPAIPGWGVGVCVFMRARRLYPANPGLLSWCLCLGSCFWLSARNSWFGCSGVCVFRVRSACTANPGYRVRCGCLCFGSDFGCAPPFLVGVFCRVCLCARSTFTPPILAGVCGVWVRLALCLLQIMTQGWQQMGT